MPRWALCLVFVCLLPLTACAALPAGGPPAPTAPVATVDTVVVPMTYAREPTQITLVSLGGKLQLTGQGTELVQGTVAHTADVPQPSLTASEGAIGLVQLRPRGELDMAKAINEWTLQLNGTTPIQLSVQSGAQTADLDLGNMRLRGFGLNEGASNTRVNFSTPNPEEMRRMTITTGASKIELLNLLNAHFASMVFEGGAGDFTLDFGGKPQRNTQAQIRSGGGNVVVRVPATVGTKITVAGGVKPTVEGELLSDAGAYITAAWRKSESLDITVTAASGTVKLTTTAGGG